jgi:hypothetical protein
MSRHVSARGGFLFHALRLFEIARVLVRFDLVASFIVNANQGVTSAAAVLGIADCAAGSIRFAVPQPTEGQRMGD